MHPRGLIIHIKTGDFYKDIADDVQKSFDISNYEVDWPLPRGTHKNVTGDCNWTRTQNHLVLERTLDHLAKLAK